MYSIKNYVYDFGIFALVSNGFFFSQEYQYIYKSVEFNLDLISGTMDQYVIFQNQIFQKNMNMKLRMV